MARKRSKDNPWVGYEDQVRERLTEALSGRGPGAGSIAQLHCAGRRPPSISKKSLMALVAEITGQGCTSTLHQWLKDPGQVPWDMAELLSRLLGFDNAEHVRTGMSKASQRIYVPFAEWEKHLLDEAAGYLLLLKEDEEIELALAYLRSLAMAHYDGHEQDDALKRVAKGKAAGALGGYKERQREAARMRYWWVDEMPPKWRMELDRLESEGPRLVGVPDETRRRRP